jgi:three-Cys-motif partner protein
MSTENFFEHQTLESRVKTGIVTDFFATWINIVGAKSNGPLAYMELFAGPGVFDDGTKSTPILIAEHVLADAARRQRVMLVLNEKDSRFADRLESNIKALDGYELLRHEPVLLRKEVGTDHQLFLKQISGIPAVIFVDPWGYKGVSLKLFADYIRDGWGRDGLFFFNYLRINAGLSNSEPSIHAHMQRMFGDERADELRERLRFLSPHQREPIVLDAMTTALKAAGIKYVHRFNFSKRNDHLFFITMHPKGLQAIKGVMKKWSSVDSEGVPLFSTQAIPEPPAQQSFAMFHAETELEKLRRDLLLKFAGRTVSFDEMFIEHHPDTRCIEANYREVLRQLEDERLISVLVPPGTTRRAGTYGKRIRIIFPKNGGK